MEKEDYKFEVTNLKISVKLPQAVSLEFVEDRCKLLQPTTTSIYCSRRRENILTVRYNNFTYIRSSEVPPEGIIPSQHCNITKLKSDSDITKAIENLFFLVDQSPTVLNYNIDNISCIADTFQSVDISALYINEQRISCKHNKEGFPVILYCPQEVKRESKKSLLFGL